VVGVHVADDDGADAVVVGIAAEVGERSSPQVEDDRRLAVVD
jgi:hypothetical protein